MIDRFKECVADLKEPQLFSKTHHGDCRSCPNCFTEHYERHSWCYDIESSCECCGFIESEQRFHKSFLTKRAG